MAAGINQDLRDNLRAFIDERGYKHLTIAKKAGISPSKLSAILNKRRKLDAHEMLKFCEILNIKPEDLERSGLTEDAEDNTLAV